MNKVIKTLGTVVVAAAAFGLIACDDSSSPSAPNPGVQEPQNPGDLSSSGTAQPPASSEANQQPESSSENAEGNSSSDEVVDSSSSQESVMDPIARFLFARVTSAKAKA